MHIQSMEWECIFKCRNNICCPVPRTENYLQKLLQKGPWVAEIAILFINTIGQRTIKKGWEIWTAKRVLLEFFVHKTKTGVTASW